MSYQASITLSAAIASVFMNTAAFADEQPATPPLTPDASFDQSVCQEPAHVFEQEFDPLIQGAGLNLAGAGMGAVTSTFNVEGRDDVMLSYTSRSDMGYVQPTRYLHQEIDGQHHTCIVSEETFKSYPIDYPKICAQELPSTDGTLDTLFNSFFKSASTKPEHLVVESVELDNGYTILQTALFESKEASETPVNRNDDPTQYSQMLHNNETGELCAIDYFSYEGLKDFNWMKRPQYFVEQPQGQTL